MNILPKSFIKSAGGVQTKFTQLFVKENIYIYQRNHLDGRLFGYETIRASTINDSHVYPGTEQFRTRGWYYPPSDKGLELAKDKAMSLILKLEEKE